MGAAPLTLLGMRNYARILYLDIDTVDQAFTDAQLNSILNDYYHWWYANYSAQSYTDVVTVSVAAGSGVVAWTPAENDVLSVASVNASATGEGLNVLSRRGFFELQGEQAAHAAGTSTSTAETGLPTDYAIRAAHLATGGVGDPKTYYIRVYPIPDATTTLTITYRATPDSLVLDGDFPRVSPFESYAIARMAAIDAGIICGAGDNLIQGLIRPLDERAQAALAMKADFLRPQSGRPEKTNP